LSINLVYIASIGRSGTTLLESMLGAHSELATMGELHIWPHEITAGGVRPCSCGAYVEDCPFWSEVRRRVDPLKQVGPGVHFFREKHNAGRTLRLDRLKGFKGAITRGEQEDIAAYGRNNKAIFEAYLEVLEEQGGGQPQWLVDASKDPYRLLWLAQSGLFNVKVIHLVKNPRAFVYSVTKEWIHSNAGAAAPKRLYYTARQSVAWTIQNHLISKVAQNVLPPEDYMLVRYETLASEPEAVFKQICAFIGCSYEPAAVKNFRSGSVHTIAGNPMRYETKDIVLDERWKRNLPYSSRKLAEIVTSVAMSRYGYR
jgi:hypothetical protein